jgi:pseudouridine synthase
MRLQKIIAMAGITSRRKAEELIRSGKVTVNGAVVKELGYQAEPEVDHIKVEGQLINRRPPRVYLMLNKPRGCVTTVSDEKGRPTVMDLLGRVKGRVFPVGRLDYDVEGLLLLTNDGELAEAIAHPSHGVTKTYRVKVKGKPGEEALRKMSQGIKLKDGHRPRARVRVKKTLKRNCWLEIKVREGKKHMVKNLCREAGFSPLRVVRTGIASLDLEGLPSGKYRHLTQEEIIDLKKTAGILGAGDKGRRN